MATTLDVYNGFPFEINVSISDEDGSPLDLTGYTVSGNIQQKFSDEEALDIFYVTILTPETDGVIKIRLTAEQLTALPKTQLIYHIGGHNSDSTEYRTFLSGYINVHPQVQL